MWPKSNKLKQLQKEAFEHNTETIKEIHDDPKYKKKTEKGLRGFPRLF